MGGSESTTRKVSFGLDEEDRVRVLHGVKLSEEVLQRMRDSKPIRPQDNKTPDKSVTRSGATATGVQEELRKRYEQEQAMVKEELSRLAQKEKEIGKGGLSGAVLRERAQAREDAKKANQLARQLDQKEDELKQLAAFYKEQLMLRQEKNMDYYKQISEQYHEAATKAESQIRPRNTAPVCTDLQAKILRCYRDNREQTLQCSCLAKQYMQCISAANKNLLVNHG